MSMFKKFLALLLCLTLALSVTACAEEEVEDNSAELEAIEETLAAGDSSCVHEWGKWDEMVESTCTNDGIQVRTCELCGKQESETLPAFGHDYDDGRCSECDKKEKKCEHDDTEEVIIKAATCTEKGLMHEICQDCWTMVDDDRLDALGHNYVWRDYQDATCTEQGWYSHEICENCGDGWVEYIEPYGHSFVMGSCVSCGVVDETFEVVTAEGLVLNEYTVLTNPTMSHAGTPAQIDVHAGSLDAKGEIDQYSITASVTGVHRFWLAEVYSGNYLKLYIYDSMGNRLDYSTYCVNGDGLALTLNAGETYTVEVHQQTGLCTYELRMGYAKESVDISSCGVVTDKIDFKSQEIHYSFSPAISGTYRFDFSNIVSGNYLKIYLYNYLGERVEYSTYCVNGDGITAKLTAGQTYTLHVCYQTGLCDYTLSIGHQTPTLDISEYTSIKDAITYNGQWNYYTFVAQSENCRLEMSDIPSNNEVKLYLYNSLGETVDYYTYCGNGDGLSVDSLNVGETYTVAVGYCYDLTGYTLNLYSSGKTMDVSSNMAVHDFHEYNRQNNVYNFVADEAGDHRFMILNVDGSVAVQILDMDGNAIDSDSYMYDGDYLYLSDVAVGDRYVIVVTAYNGCYSYTLCIQ